MSERPSKKKQSGAGTSAGSGAGGANPSQSDVTLAPLFEKTSILSLSRDRRTIIGHKGHRLTRANAGVSSGTWYCEFTVLDLKPGAHVRIGFATQKGQQSAPVGFDQYSYCYRDEGGVKVHQSVRHRYGKPYGTGDVIGCLISFDKACLSDDELREAEMNDEGASAGPLDAGRLGDSLSVATAVIDAKTGRRTAGRDEVERAAVFSRLPPRPRSPRSKAEYRPLWKPEVAERRSATAAEETKKHPLVDPRNHSGAVRKLPIREEIQAKEKDELAGLAFHHAHSAGASAGDDDDYEDAFDDGFFDEPALKLPSTAAMEQKQTVTHRFWRSHIRFFLNGVDQGIAFIHLTKEPPPRSDSAFGLSVATAGAGGEFISSRYFPAVSCYDGAAVRFNPGPNFAFPPKPFSRFQQQSDSKLPAPGALSNSSSAAMDTGDAVSLSSEPAASAADERFPRYPKFRPFSDLTPNDDASLDYPGVAGVLSGIVGEAGAGAGALGGWLFKLVSDPFAAIDAQTTAGLISASSKGGTSMAAKHAAAVGTIITAAGSAPIVIPKSGGGGGGGSSANDKEKEKEKAAKKKATAAAKPQGAGATSSAAGAKKPAAPLLAGQKRKASPGPSASTATAAASAAVASSAVTTASILGSGHGTGTGSSSAPASETPPAAAAATGALAAGAVVAVAAALQPPPPKRKKQEKQEKTSLPPAAVPATGTDASSAVVSRAP